MSLGRRFLADEGHTPKHAAAADVFVGIICAVALLFVAGIIIHAIVGAR